MNIKWLIRLGLFLTITLTAIHEAIATPGCRPEWTGDARGCQAYQTSAACNQGYGDKDSRRYRCVWVQKNGEKGKCDEAHVFCIIP